MDKSPNAEVVVGFVEKKTKNPKPPFSFQTMLETDKLDSSAFRLHFKVHSLTQYLYLFLRLKANFQVTKQKQKHVTTFFILKMSFLG
jgi:hypothetical protein